MANKKLTQLNAGVLPVDTDLFFTSQDVPTVPVSKKITGTQLKAYIGTGDVSGPLSSTDTAIAKWDGVGGDTLADSGVLIDGSNNLSGITNITLSGTVDTGQGANELYSMNQDVETTDAVTFVTVNTGQGNNDLHPMNQAVRTTDPVTFTTLNTGQGANELYAMDQDVTTTDAVVFTSIYIGSGSIDSSSAMQADSTTKGLLPPRMTTAQKNAIASPATGLVVYDTDLDQWEGYNGTAWFALNLDNDLIVHSTTWGGAFSTPISGGNISIYKVGRIVIAHFSDISGTADTANTINATTNLPNTLFPENLLGEQIRPISVTDNGTAKTGYLNIAATNGAMSISAGQPGTSFAGAGSTGFQDFYISWIANIPGGP